MSGIAAMDSGVACKPIPDMAAYKRTLREARALLETVRPAAIILDILLWGEDAWGMLPYLKTNPDMRDVPVFVVTNVDDRQKAMSLGADAFAQKPNAAKSERFRCR